MSENNRRKGTICSNCSGKGKLYVKDGNTLEDILIECPKCGGRGWVSLKKSF